MANNITDIERLNYYEGEFLGALDFQAEQEYHRDMRRRHNVGQHTWGIVSGLELVQIPNGNNVPGSNPQVPEVDVFIQPGMAVDAFGREIVVLNKTQLTQDLFASFSNLTGAQTMSIWISYGQLMLQPPQDACTQINQPNAFGRVQESFALTVSQNGTKPPNDLIVVDRMTLPAPPPPQPGDIVVPNDDSIPYQEFSSDDSTVNWHILLGQVTWYPPILGVFGKLDDSKAAVGRLYCGSVASTIYAPAAALTLKDRFTPSPLPTGSNGVSVEVEGSLTVDRLLNAEQSLLVGSVFDPNSKLTISPVTINGSSADQSFIQFRDSSGPLFSIWETPAKAGPPKIPAGLNFGETDSTGKPNMSDLLIQGGNVGIDPGNQNGGSGLTPGLSFGSKPNGPPTEGIGSNQSGGGPNAFGLDFYTAVGTPRLSITNGGNVGIGTAATPSTKLQVEGDSDPHAAVTIRRSDNNKFMRLGVGSSGVALDFDPTSFFVIQKNTLGIGGNFAGQNLLFVGGNGKVGIGTVSPSHQLEVVDTTNTGLRVQTNIAGGTVASFGGFGDFQIDAPGVVGGRMIVKENGNVGIGTTAPSAQLEVSGTVKLQGKSLVQIYRLYNSSTGDHFYTPSASERASAMASGYVDETSPTSSFFAFV